MCDSWTINIYLLLNDCSLQAPDQVLDLIWLDIFTGSLPRPTSLLIQYTLVQGEVNIKVKYRSQKCYKSSFYQDSSARFFVMDFFSIWLLLVFPLETTRADYDLIFEKSTRMYSSLNLNQRSLQKRADSESAVHLWAVIIHQQPSSDH